MGQLGRITSIADLSDKNIFLSYIQNALNLNKEGIKIDKQPPVKPFLVKLMFIKQIVNKIKWFYRYISLGIYGGLS